MARPTKLTPAVEKAITDALRMGATRTAAFEAAGVHRSKISVYLRDKATFRDAVLVAEANAELRATIAVRQQINLDNWKAATWWLERRRPEDWGRRDRLEVVATVRQLARENNLTVEEEAEAVAEAIKLMQEHQRATRG